MAVSFKQFSNLNMTVTARFVCESVTHFESYNDDIHFAVKMRASTKSDLEDNNYSKYTPTGSFEITVTNPDLVDYFQPGGIYDFEITRHFKPNKES